MTLARRLAATLALAILAACSARAPAPHGVLTPNGYPMDFASLAAGDEDEARERDLAAISAEYNLRLEADENGPPTAAQILRAHEQRKALARSSTAAGLAKSAGLNPSQWQALGPSNVAGRVRSFAIDPRNPARLLAGSASGGLWISTDSGGTWRANQDFLPNLSISAIAFDPLDPVTVYMGTGEASAGLVGLGVFKSSDGGTTWRFLEATNVDGNPDWRFVNRIAVHPSQAGVVLAAMTNNVRTLGAIYRSADGGATWTRVSAAKALDIAFDPNTPSNALAGLDDGTLAYSRDGGLTWARTAPLVPSPSGRNNTARAEIAFARSQRGLAYASVDNNKGELWRSLDSGATWQLASNPQHLNVQGDYDNAIWVDPTDANHVIVAGLDAYQSRDGGATFNRVSNWRQWPSSPHADHHALVSPPDFSASNPVLYDAGDGGVYRAPNVYSVATTGWANINAGLPTVQFYSGAGRASAGGRIVGGTQDNGTFMLDGGFWRRYDGGDGGFVAVDPRSDATVYSEYVYLALQRTLDAGASLTRICEGISEALPSDGDARYCGPDATKKANFIAPFILDPNNPDRLLAGAASLWVTDAARAIVTWRSIKDPSPVTDNFINAIAVAEGNGNVTWVGYNNGEVHKSSDALSFAPGWTRVGAGVLPSQRQVQRIVIDRDNANHVMVAFTGFVAGNLWETRDGGASWSSISGNLPFAPVFDVKRHPSNPTWLYAATSVGVFTSENGGATWSTTNEGPANIRVRELFWLDATTLVASTYGRGMFRIAVTAAPASYQDLWWAGPQENGWGMSLSQHGATIFGAMYVYDAQGKPLWVVLPGGTWNGSFTAYSGALYIPSGSWYGNYDVNRFVANPSVGNATITFTGPSTATLAYTINGVSGTKAITRQLFGPQDGTPVASYTDLWWGGPSQNGWGVAITQQYRTIFAVWYTYDANGRTVWYVVPAGSWTAANVYTGTAYRTTGSPWLGVPYDPAMLNAPAVGTVTFTFTDLNNAVMSYTVDGVSGSKPITRQSF